MIQQNKALECKTTIELVAALKDMPEAKLDVDHVFTPGLYTRTMRAESGAMIVGRIHKISSVNILSKGSISISENGAEPITYIAPCVWESPANSQKIGMTFSEVILTNVYPTDKTDIESVEQQILYSEESKIEEIECQQQS